MTSFRLDGLLRVRRFEEDRAAAELAARTIECQEADGRVVHAHHALADHELSGRSGPQEWRLAVTSRMAATTTLADARAARSDREGQQLAARGRWSEARTRSASLGKLADEHARREAHEEARREQATLDEIAIRAVGLRRQEESA